MSDDDRLRPVAGRADPHDLRRAAVGTLMLGLLGFSSILQLPAAGNASDSEKPGISRRASDSCARKVSALEKEAARKDRRTHPVTRFSENEINSFMAIGLRPRIQPSLKSLQFVFKENSLTGIAEIDFDNLSISSTKALAKMIARLFTGIHNLTVQGKLVTEAGLGSFQLEEAHFDGNVLPGFLVNEVITAVGKKQKPPFDPLQPSKMPYAIDRVEIHAGYILVYQ